MLARKNKAEDLDESESMDGSDRERSQRRRSTRWFIREVEKSPLLEAASSLPYGSRIWVGRRMGKEAASARSRLERRVDNLGRAVHACLAASSPHALKEGNQIWEICGHICTSRKRTNEVTAAHMVAAVNWILRRAKGLAPHVAAPSNTFEARSPFLRSAEAYLIQDFQSLFLCTERESAQSL